MELQQLKYFLQVVEEGSFTRAAERLGISQSALSRSVQKLEEELGQPLLERKPRSVSLTEAGMLMQTRAKQVLAILEDTRAEIVDDGQTGTLRVGAIPTIGPYFLPEVLRRFARSYPRATVLVREETTDRLLKSCQEGDVDVAVIALPVEARYLEVEKLFEEELLLVLPRQHELASKEKILFDELQPHPFVLLHEVHCLTDQLLTFCRQRAFQPVAVERASQLSMVLELVALGHGISFVPLMARRLDRVKRRVYRSVARPKPHRQVAVAWNPYRFQSRLQQAFLQHLREESVLT